MLSHNRHSHLQRILNYYKDIDVKIVVADSTKDSFPLKENFNIDYYHYPDYSFFEKMNDVFQKVKTPYILMCPIDDLIIPSAVSKCINFLEVHKDYTSVQGHWFRFGIKRGVISFWPDHIYLQNINYDVNGETPEKRMNQFMTLYMHPNYSVHKTENLRIAFKMIEKFNGALAYDLTEHIMGLVSVINGKHKILPFLYIVRERHPLFWDIKDPLLEPLYTIPNNPEMRNQYGFFINSISQYLSDKYNYGIENSKKFVLEAIDRYLNFNRLNQKKFSKYDIIERLNIRNKNISFIIKKIFPRIYNKISSKKLFQSLENHSLNKYGYSEILKIREHIIKYPIKD